MLPNLSALRLPADDTCVDTTTDSDSLNKDYFQDDGDKRLVRSQRYVGDGMVAVTQYDGPKGEEAKARVSYIRRSDRVQIYVEIYLGEKGAERLHRRVYSALPGQEASAEFYQGGRGEERLVRIVY